MILNAKSTLIQSYLVDQLDNANDNLFEFKKEKKKHSSHQFLQSILIFQWVYKDFFSVEDVFNEALRDVLNDAFALAAI